MCSSVFGCAKYFIPYTTFNKSKASYSMIAMIMSSSYNVSYHLPVKNLYTILILQSYRYISVTWPEKIEKLYLFQIYKQCGRILQLLEIVQN